MIQSGATAVSQFAAQAIRFGTNVVLASLLSPAIFGLLAIVTTVRTGIELLSDMGINQSIIVSKDGDRQGFVETAWGIKILRGFILAAIGAATAYPLAAFYQQEELTTLLLVGSIGSIIVGVGRPGPTLLQRNRQVGKVIAFRLLEAAAGAICTIGVVLVMPTALGVILGGLLGRAITSALSFAFLSLPGYVPRIHKEYRSKIVTFGKWIFLSSVIYFFAQNFDRLYLPMNIPLAIFGVYAIARSISEVVVQTVAQINQMVVMPAVARSADAIEEKRDKLAKTRFAGLALVAAGIGVLIALGDLIILTIFDDRYALGAVILPILLAGAWFTVLASVSGSLLMGLGHSKPMAASSAVRLATAVIGLPIAFGIGGLPAGLVVIALADLPRYLWLSLSTAKHKVAFPVQDAVLLLLMIGAAIGARELLVLIGLVDGFISSAQSSGMAELFAATAPGAS